MTAMALASGVISLRSWSIGLARTKGRVTFWNTVWPITEACEQETIQRFETRRESRQPLLRLRDEKVRGKAEQGNDGNENDNPDCDAQEYLELVEGGRGVTAED